MPNLTKFSAAGGCSCKLPADQLDDLLNGTSALASLADNGSADDAAFSELANGDVLVSSVDFQNPILDDPYLAGMIGGLNAVSDIFACGVQPQWAEVVLALPQIDRETKVAIGREMMRGLMEACSGVGCQIVGGHTIEQPAPLIGLAVRGTARPEQIKRKSGARPGDVVLVTKPVGNGIAVAARQVGFLIDADWKVAQDMLLTANSVGKDFGAIAEISSLTDITGFGLIGHSLEVATSSNVTFEIDVDNVPALPGTKRAAETGFVPQLAASTWEFSEAQVGGKENLTNGEKMFLADPQTNGGLLATVARDAVEHVIETASRNGVEAVVIGEVRERDTYYCNVRKGTS